MTKLSIGRAWSETIAAVKRDGRLIVPVALAFSVVPATLFALAVPPVPAGQIREPGMWMVLYLLLILAALIGQMAIMRLAIGPAASVGEAIRHALRRAPSVIGAALIFGIPAAAILLPLAMPVVTNPSSPPPTATFMLLAASILCFACGCADAGTPLCRRGDRPVAIIKRSWALTGAFLAVAGDGVRFESCLDAKRRHWVSIG